MVVSKPFPFKLRTHLYQISQSSWCASHHCRT